MKAIVLAFAVLFASVSAIPQPMDEKATERIVDSILVSIIEDLIASLRERGLDPYQNPRVEGSWGLPVPTVFSVWGYAENVQLLGLSNIIINHVSYGLLTGRLTLELAMPELYGSVSNARGAATILRNEITGNGNGEIAISGITVNAEANVNISILGGVSLSSLDIVGKIDNISSDLTLVVQDYDLSSYANAAFNEIILRYLNEFADEINQLISHYALIIINNRL